MVRTRKKKAEREAIKQDAAYLAGVVDEPAPRPEEIAAPEIPEQTVYFESRLSEAMQSIYQAVAAMRQRGTPGALRHGVTGAHIVIQEILDNATEAQAYLTIAAYAVAAGMLAAQFYNLPTIPQPEQVNEQTTAEELAPDSTP